MKHGFIKSIDSEFGARRIGQWTISSGTDPVFFIDNKRYRIVSKIVSQYCLFTMKYFPVNATGREVTDWLESEYRRLVNEWNVLKELGFEQDVIPGIYELHGVNHENVRIMFNCQNVIVSQGRYVANGDFHTTSRSYSSLDLVEDLVDFMGGSMTVDGWSGMNPRLRDLILERGELQLQ